MYFKLIVPSKLYAKDVNLKKVRDQSELRAGLHRSDEYYHKKSTAKSSSKLK